MSKIAVKIDLIILMYCDFLLILIHITYIQISDKILALKCVKY